MLRDLQSQPTLVWDYETLGIRSCLTLKLIQNTKFEILAVWVRLVVDTAAATSFFTPNPISHRVQSVLSIHADESANFQRKRPKATKDIVDQIHRWSVSPLQFEQYSVSFFSESSPDDAVLSRAGRQNGHWSLWCCRCPKARLRCPAARCSRRTGTVTSVDP